MTKCGPDLPHILALLRWVSFEWGWGHAHASVSLSWGVRAPPPPPLPPYAGLWSALPLVCICLLLNWASPPCVTFRRVVVPLRGPGQSPARPFACCVGSLRSVGRCGRCSGWCRFRVRRAQYRPAPPPPPRPAPYGCAITFRGDGAVPKALHSPGHAGPSMPGPIGGGRALRVGLGDWAGAWLRSWGAPGDQVPCVCACDPPRPERRRSRACA